MALSEQDRIEIKLTIENSINSFMSVVEEKTQDSCIHRIDEHRRSCPWGLDYDKTKAKTLAFVVGAAMGGGAAGGGIVAALLRIFA